MKFTRTFVFIAISAFLALGMVRIMPGTVQADTTPAITGSDDTDIVVPDTSASNAPDVVSPGTVGSDAPEVVVATTTPALTGSNGNDSGSILPNTSGSNSDDSGSILPNTQGSNGDDSSTSPSSTPPNTQGSNGDETSTTTPTPVVTPEVSGGGNSSGGGSSSGSGGYYGGSSSGGSSTIVPTPPTFTATCPLLTSYINIGAKNDPTEVMKLQIFLKNVEGANLTVNGIYDLQTVNAVKAFQTKYLATIMGPWNSTRASGFVYIMTVKKINELACQQPIIVSAADQAIIDAYTTKLAAENQLNPSNETQVGPLNPGSTVSSTTASSTNPDIGAANGNSANTASVANTNIFGRFWSFIVNLFK